MDLWVRSGKFHKLVSIPVNDRIRAHRLACLQAIVSGQNLGRVINTTIHVDYPEAIYDDDLFTLTEFVEEMYGR